MDFSMFETIENTAHETGYNHMFSPKKSTVNNTDGRFPKNTPIAMAYVPCQQWNEPYSIEKGFCSGTIFPELDLPFTPEEGCI